MATAQSLVCSDVIQSARDLHPTFDSRRHPNPVLVRALQRYQRKLLADIARVNPTILTTTLATDLPLSDFDAGITLPADLKYPLRVEVLDPNASSSYEVDMISWLERLRYALAVCIRNGVLYLTGVATDWSPFTQVTLYYVAEADDLTNASSALILPNSAENCLVAYLGQLMAKRGAADPKVPQPDAAQFLRDWVQAEDDFIGEMGMQQVAQVGVTRDVF